MPHQQLDGAQVRRASSNCVAKLCRSVCKLILFLKPARVATAAAQQLFHTVLSEIGRSTVLTLLGKR